MSDADFVVLLEGARAGDDRATATLLETFEADVRLMVRVRLPKVLRSRFDTMDFVQAVWQSVFARDGRVAAITNPGRFRGYLAGVARNKILEEFRRRTCTRKFDLGREEPLYVRRGLHYAPRDLPGNDPSPSQVAQADECLDRLVAGRSPVDAQIIRLRSEGRTLDDIAASMGLSERSVRRAIEEARRRVEQR